MTNLTNHFLIAMPTLTGSYFGESLIYLCEHNDQGALGFVVNRASSVTLLKLSAELGFEKGHSLADQPVLEGGPVGTERGFVLHFGEQKFNDTREIASGIMLSSSPDAIASLTRLQGPENALIFLGYAGWGPNQLEQEIADNAWLTSAASREVLFDAPISDRFHAAGRHIGIDLRLISGRLGNA